MKDAVPPASPATDAGATLRRDRIVALVLEHEFVRVTDLAEIFGVSSVTIRADLELLDRQGALRRVRGGAMHVKAAPPPDEPSYEAALGSSAIEKAQLARHAAALVTDGESVIIDAGTTTTFLARALVARSDLSDVVIFTNSLRVAAELEPAIPRFSVLVTGGTLRPATHALVDPLGAPMLERIHADTVFLGCHGVHLESGVTGANLLEAELKRRMINASQRRIVLADSTKLDRVGLAPICELSEVNLLISDADAPPGFVSAVRERGVGVELAK
ncbi:DeoR/GlpR family DNA-binding transcription regulator [Microbispora sp. GKU 823]|uniref:DeoR/GlpR family DNA-binding transcription regulator n=1 Tax=Microbispora sp. GKU 823 TaxID=1652100 RepID=UPI0009A3B538|nr:DeoR/GlpR family DNA-binding transcription regulator [Microbispora sp. GKU 823]OPG09272.1 DeoR family transcriptional regulator [Microbispora sp. GKU 823]